MNRTALRPSLRATLSRLVTVGVVIGLLAVPAAAEVYIVTLTNGNTFLSKYKPREAAYDTSKLLIMTDVGNIIALDKQFVAEIASDTESRGFGVVIDTATIMIGYTMNDAPLPGEEGEAGQLPQGAFPGQGAFGGFAPPPLTNQLIAEPNSGGGIPVSFITGGVAPISAPIPP